MDKNNKHQDFGDMPLSEIQEWENTEPVIVLFDSIDRNDLAFYKSESFTDNIPNRDALIVFQNNMKNKNMSVLSREQAQQLKQFLNEHF